MSDSKEDEIEEYYHFKDYKDWFEHLQEAPNETWIDKRDLGSKKSLFVPLWRQQAVADLFFKEFDVVEEKYQEIKNEILCTVKIQFLPSYPHSEYRYMTGTGAKPIQQSKGSLASQYPDGKITNAVEYNAGAARAAAISNALNTFGNIFGRNLNRKTSDNFSYSRKDQKKPKTE